MTNNIIASSPNIQGDITQCKIETALINTERDSAFSFNELNTYQSYNVCSKETLNTFTVQEITNLGVFGFLIPLILLIMFGFLAFISFIFG